MKRLLLSLLVTFCFFTAPTSAQNELTVISLFQITITPEGAVNLDYVTILGNGDFKNIDIEKLAANAEWVEDPSLKRAEANGIVYRAEVEGITGILLRGIESFSSISEYNTSEELETAGIARVLIERQANTVILQVIPVLGSGYSPDYGMKSIITMPTITDYSEERLDTTRESDAGQQVIYLLPLDNTEYTVEVIGGVAPAAAIAPTLAPSSPTTEAAPTPTAVATAAPTAEPTEAPPRTPKEPEAGNEEQPLAEQEGIPLWPFLFVAGLLAGGAVILGLSIRAVMVGSMGLGTDAGVFRLLSSSARNTTAKELAAFSGRSGWYPFRKNPTSPLSYVDKRGVPRITIKKGSVRTPGSEIPHASIRNFKGELVDNTGKPTTRRSPGNHTPIDWNLD